MIDWPELEARNAELRAFVDLDRNARGSDGPLAGMRVGVKSNIAVEGLPWTAGTALRRDVVAERDAAVVARLRAAGAIILGTLNMHEAALGATTNNPWFGRTDNPHRSGYTSGGSSGGSGAAVAAGLCDAALGTDTLGSVRIPAAYNGVYGLKPTLGAVSNDGLVPLAPSFDCIGPLARDLDVLERVWTIMFSGEGRSLGPGLRRGTMQRVLVLDDFAGVVTEPGVRAGYERALSAVEGPGEEISLPDEAGAIRTAGFVQAGRELLASLGPDREARADLLSKELRFLLEFCARTEPQPALLASTADALRTALGEDGVLMLPTAPQAAFAHGSRTPANQADFTTLASIAGLPALSIPAGTDASGLPVAVQLVGPADSEFDLIAIARTLEPVLGGAVPLPD